jgi:type VI secretion system secreted protein Hcp
VSLAPAPLGNRTAALGLVIMGSGRSGFNFPFVSQALVVASGFSSGAGAGSRRVALHDIQITKLIDKSSPKLFHAAVTGTHFSTVKIVLAKAGKVFETITLSQVVVASVREGGRTGSEPPSESVTLNFTKMEIAYK